jgi:hypothetical protein
VHEKAILMVTIPLAVLVAAGLMPNGRAAAGGFFFLNTGEPTNQPSRRMGNQARAVRTDMQLRSAANQPATQDEPMSRQGL